MNSEYLLEGLVLKLISNTLATWCKEPTSWKRPWCWERLRARGEEGDRGWDSWMASLTQQTWIWINSEWWWRTGKPGVLQSMELQRVGHDLEIEKKQQTFNIEWINNKVLLYGTKNCIQYPMRNHNGKKYKNQIYNWIPLLYRGKWHNIVNQLYFNRKKKK